ncbi:Protein N-acetyltransferase, RimJ/RimL family [Sinosporangium album]|uniref:Protein N-acetyltransferase, RimJ/RimL family n=1 Tax=Sinosporangium album TaxID=504805 RepID=A0A1G8HZG3_9ACTN|nr:GNAT family protein [Sinosporangium album]SDI11830.1 Protein N-acetyltransferase, RimJ/RimL family [Sinosporangium album]
MYPVTLTSGTVGLREFANPEDADAVLAIYGDPRVTAHLSFEPRDRAQVTATLAAVTAAARVRPRTEYSLAAVRLPGDVVGDVVAFARLAVDTQHPGQNSGQIGFALRADQWGQGLGTEVVALLLRLGFDELGLHRVWAARSPHNHVSGRLMEKVGMIEEGRIRDHLRIKDKWRDSIVHSILEHEWRAGRARAG